MINKGFNCDPATSFVEHLVNLDCWIKATGSRVTSHFTEDSDFDYVVYDKFGNVEKYLVKEGFYLGGSERAESEFLSYKRGSFNFIVTKDKNFFLKFVQATELIRTIDPKTKEERIKLFDMILSPDKEPVAF